MKRIAMFPCGRFIRDLTVAILLHFELPPLLCCTTPLTTTGCIYSQHENRCIDKPLHNFTQSHHKATNLDHIFKKDISATLKQ